MTRTLRPTPARPRLGAAAAWSLALALLFAQWLGLAHGVSHAGHAPRAAAHAEGCTHAAGGQTAFASAGLFGHSSDDTAACRLLDQAAGADVLLATAATVPPPAPAQALACTPQGSAGSACAASYQARAPPTAA